MSTINLKEQFTQGIGRGRLTLQKYSPEILLGAGLIGAIVAAVMAAKATLGASDIVDQHNEKIHDIEVTRDATIEENMIVDDNEVLKDKARVYAQTAISFGKLYGPALGLGVLSVSAILASHGIMGRRQVSLIAAYNLVSEGFQSYRNRVVEELGAGKDMEFSLGLRETTTKVKEVDPETGKTVKIKKHGFERDLAHYSIYSRFFDESNRNYARGSRALNKAFLLAKQNYFNDILTIDGHLFLNQVYKELGFPETKEGQLVGWVLRTPDKMKAEKRDGYVDLGIFDWESDTAREFVNETNPTILINPNVDGIIYHLI